MLDVDPDIEKVIRISGRNPNLCFQCGMCTAVCPMAEFMDVKPHQIVRLLQLESSKVFSIDAVWVCASCMACVDRCPRDVGPGILFEAIRLVQLRRGIDKIDYKSIVEIEAAPTIALVTASRKYTG